MAIIGHGYNSTGNGDLFIDSGLQVWFDGKDPVPENKKDETCRGHSLERLNIGHRDGIYDYSGDIKSWEIANNGNLSFRFVERYGSKETDLLSLFEEGGKKVYVDDVLLKQEDYLYAQGSLIIRLRDRFLNTLSEGKHTLRVVFPDGDASTVFYVTRKSEKPHYVIPITGVE